MQVRKNLNLDIKFWSDEIDTEELSVDMQDGLIESAKNHIFPEILKGYICGQLLEPIEINGIEYEFGGWWELKEPTFAELDQ